MKRADFAGCNPRNGADDGDQTEAGQGADTAPPPRLGADLASGSLGESPCVGRDERACRLGSARRPRTHSQTAKNLHHACAEQSARRHRSQSRCCVRIIDS